MGGCSTTDLNWFCLNDECQHALIRPSQSALMSASRLRLICKSELHSAGLLAQCILLYISTKKHHCHYAATSLSCSNCVTIYGGISKFLFQVGFRRGFGWTLNLSS